MVRLLVLYQKPEDPAAFDRHYREVHAPLTKKMPGLLRFTVSKGIRGLGSESSFYLVAEADFADADALRAALRSEEGRAVGQDAASFAAGLTSMLTYEVEEV